MLIPEDAKNQNFSFEQASLKTDFSAQVKELSERRVPFKKGEMAEKNNPELFQNTALESKNKEKLSKTPENPEKNHADAKKAGKKRRAVDVQDLRTQTGDEAGTIAERGLKVTEEIRNSSEKEIVVELRFMGERDENTPESTQKVPAGTNDGFEQLLARELRGDLSTDIVRQAAIVLRDGGEGTIRLSLKPESLGKVKIHLEIAENRILGHIFVDNEEALRAFEQEIHTLEQSFKDSGFDASLNAALDYQDRGQRWKEKEIEPFFSGRFAASYEESSSTEFTGDFSTGFGVNAINVLV
jgi:flagellar hook-length control protein FliK